MDQINNDENYAYKPWDIKSTDIEAPSLLDCRSERTRSCKFTQNGPKLLTQLVRLGGYTNINCGEVSLSLESGIKICLIDYDQIRIEFVIGFIDCMYIAGLFHYPAHMIALDLKKETAEKFTEILMKSRSYDKKSSLDNVSSTRFTIVFKPMNRSILHPCLSYLSRLFKHVTSKAKCRFNYLNRSKSEKLAIEIFKNDTTILPDIQKFITTPSVVASLLARTNELAVINDEQARKIVEHDEEKQRLGKRPRSPDSEQDIQHELTSSNALTEQNLNGTSTASNRSSKRLSHDKTSLISSSFASATPLCFTRGHEGSHMSLGPVEIDEHEFEARFIRIRNTSNTDIAIGQWILRRVADHRHVEYEFDSSAIIKAGQQIVVWSANQSDGVIQNPTNGDYVMDARWLAGKSMATTLLDEKGILQARRETFIYQHW